MPKNWSIIILKLDPLLAFILIIFSKEYVVIFVNVYIFCVENTILMDEAIQKVDFFWEGEISEERGQDGHEYVGNEMIKKLFH